MVKENHIKSEARKLFEGGKSESEAHKELSKTHSSCNISEKAVNSWYEKFRSQNRNLNDKKAARSRRKLTDELLIGLIKENPDRTMAELARLANVTVSTIKSRIDLLESDGGTAYYIKKVNIKLTDEFIIDLVNKNPLLNMTQLANLAGVSIGTISRRIKQINSNDERVKYVKKKYIPKGFNGSFSKLTDEYVINLVNENPKLNMHELAELSGVSQFTISNRINNIKLSGKSVDYTKKGQMKFTDDFLINLVDENPSFTHEELAMCANTSTATITRRIKQVNSNGERVKYTNKKGGKLKITDEFLIDLVSKNPGLSMIELAKLAGISVSNISRRLKEINSDGEKVKYADKKRRKLKITDEFLIDLVSKNPDLSMTELAKLAGVSQSTISNRLKKINIGEERVVYISKKPCKGKPDTSE